MFRIVFVLFLHGPALRLFACSETAAILIGARLESIISERREARRFPRTFDLEFWDTSCHRHRADVEGNVERLAGRRGSTPLCLRCGEKTIYRACQKGRKIRIIISNRSLYDRTCSELSSRKSRCSRIRGREVRKRARFFSRASANSICLRIKTICKRTLSSVENAICIVRPRVYRTGAVARGQRSLAFGRPRGKAWKSSSTA